MLEVLEGIEEIGEEKSEYPREYGFDFKEKKLTGEIVEGIDALKVWCYFALKTERFRFRAFPWDYGSEVFELVGKTYGFDYIESEVQRMITDCVCAHPLIENCEDFLFKNDGSRIEVTFSIVTDFGNGKIEIEQEDLFNV